MIVQHVTVLAAVTPVHDKFIKPKGKCKCNLLFCSHTPDNLGHLQPLNFPTRSIPPYLPQSCLISVNSVDAAVLLTVVLPPMTMAHLLDVQIVRIAQPFSPTTCSTGSHRSLFSASRGTSSTTTRITRISSIG